QRNMIASTTVVRTFHGLWPRSSTPTSTEPAGQLCAPAAPPLPPAYAVSVGVPSVTLLGHPSSGLPSQSLSLPSQVSAEVLGLLALTVVVVVSPLQRELRVSVFLTVS